MSILETTHYDGTEIFRMSDGVEVYVSDIHIGYVGGHPSGVEYYYDSRGYGCHTSREAALVFHTSMMERDEVPA